MLYLIFALAALFLTACGDPDNPVYTAPAGKAVANDDEVKQPPGTNYGSYEEIPYVPADPPETAAQTLAAEEEEEIPPPLVGNLEQTSGPIISFIRDHRQDFTTGSDARSWKLTAVKLFLQTTSSASATYTVEIWTTDGGATLMEKIGTLTHPSSLTNSALNEFTGDIDLAANTTYALVVDVSQGVNLDNINMRYTATGTEDGDSMAGWSIADYFYWREKDATDWNEIQGSSLIIEIHGYAIFSTQSEIDRHRTSSLPAPGPDDWYKDAWDTGDPTLRGSLEREHRYEQLVEDRVLPTLSVTGCKDGNNAVFTFSRNAPFTENVSFTFYVSGGDYDGSRITTGFGAGNARYEWNGGTVFGSNYVAVLIEPGWHNADMTGDYIVGTSTARVDNSSKPCE